MEKRKKLLLLSLIGLLLVIAYTVTALKVGELDDTTITNVNHGDLLRYNVSSGLWENYFFPLTMHNDTDGVNMVVHSNTFAENSSYYALNTRTPYESEYENEYGKLAIYPTISRNIIKQVQYCNLTSYIDDVEIDLTFRFDEKIIKPNIWIWKNISHDTIINDYGNIENNYTIESISSWDILDYTPEHLDYGDIPSEHYVICILSNLTEYILGFDSFDWLDDEHTIAVFHYNYYGLIGNHIVDDYYFDWDNIKDKFSYIEYQEKHYYYVRNVIVKEKLYNFKWEYSIPVNSDGKWDLLFKKSSDPLGAWRVIIDPWFNSDWDFYKMITINKDLIDGNLVNFPMLVNNTNTTLISKCNDGDSVRFVALDNITEYYYEIEEWTNNGFTIWVNITSVSSVTDTRFLMYYGNSGASDNQNPNNVWDSNFLAVWHMMDDYNDVVNDSTINGYGLELQNTPTINGSGLMGNCITFEVDNTEWALNTTLLDFFPDDGCTYEVWVYENTFVQPWHVIFRKLNIDSEDFFAVNANPTPNKYKISIEGNKQGAKEVKSSLLVIDKVWQYTSAIHNTNAKPKIHRNLTVDTGTASVPEINDGAFGDFSVGGRALGSTMDGSMDEIRISSIDRSENWLNATYYNQKQTVGFMSFGLEVKKVPVVYADMDFIIEFDFVKRWIKFNSNITIEGNTQLNNDVYFENTGYGLPYGTFYIHEKTVNIDITGSGVDVYVKIDGWDEGLSNNVTNNSFAFTVDKIGVYDVQWDISGESDGVNKIYEVDIFVNGVEQESGSARIETPTANSFETMSGNGRIRVLSISHDIEIRMKQVGGVASDFNIFNANFNILMIGG